jgi:hypothetical protein
MGAEYMNVTLKARIEAMRRFPRYRLQQAPEATGTV